MCLLLLAFHAVPQCPWLLLGNRDEFHARATAAAQAWDDDPAVIGGRDLEAGGSWLALNRNGRFAAVTNVRSGEARRGPRSRGDLVAAFVRGVESPHGYAAKIAARRDEYGPFNLIVGDRDAAFGASSLLDAAWPMTPGVHVLSNGPPDVLWPKARYLHREFATAIPTRDTQPSVSTEQAGLSADDARLLDLLTDTTQPDDGELPETGVGVALERMLAPIFIRGTQYGTRSSTLAYTRDDGSSVLIERRFGPDGVRLGQTRIGT